MKTKIQLLKVLLLCVFIKSHCQLYYQPFDLNNYDVDRAQRKIYCRNNVTKATLYFYESKACGNPDIRNCPLATNCSKQEVVFYDKNGFERKVPINDYINQFFAYRKDSLPDRIYFLKEGEVIFKIKYIYDSLNRIKFQHIYNNGKIISDTMEYIYNYNGNLTLRQGSMSEGKNKYTENYFYNSYNQLINSKYIGVRGDTIRIDNEFEYNSQHQLIKKTTTYFGKQYSGKSIRIYTFQYDLKGRLAFLNESSKTEFIEKKTYIYLENGLLDRIKIEYSNFKNCNWELYKYE